MKQILSIKDAEIKRGTIVLVRVDFNVSLEKKDGGAAIADALKKTKKNNEKFAEMQGTTSEETFGSEIKTKVRMGDEYIVRDDYKILRAIPTISYLQKAGAKVILLSHIEINGLSRDAKKPSLYPVYEYIKTAYAQEFSTCYFVKDLVSAEGKKSVDLLKEGEIIFAENIRMYEGEEKNDPEFASKLASLAHVYVNDAFGVSHRNHASVVGVPKLLPHYAGLLMIEEIQNLSSVLNKTLKPFVFILGGAKFETKLPLIEKYVNKADYVFVGGALANDVLVAKGLNVGTSLVSKDQKVKSELKKIVHHKNLIVPTDVWVSSGKHTEVKPVGAVGAGDLIQDIGPETMLALKPILKEAKCIVWNGPLGNYEHGWDKSTRALARLLASLDKNINHTIVGGGDTLASIKEENVFDDITFVSTGGGAMLEFLEKETLPGVEALR